MSVSDFFYQGECFFVDTLGIDIARIPILALNRCDPISVEDDVAD